jgi:hypothetical protein
MSLVAEQPRTVTPRHRIAERPGPSLNRSALYRLGGIAAALAVVATAVSVGVFAASPPPGYDEGARAWFEHIQDNKLLGLMSLDLPFLIVSLLMVPVMLALFVALRDARPTHVVVAGVLYLIAIATYLGTNTSIEMLALSDRYAAATTEAQRVALSGGAEALLAAYTGTAFHINYILGQVAGIVFGIAMLHSSLFSRKIAYLMIGGNAFGFLLYVPEVGVALSALSGVILLVWMVLVSRRLLQLAHTTS